MYEIYGFVTQHSLKPLYVAEELGVDYQFHLVDLINGEHRSENFLHKAPVGRVPVLGHDGFYLSESGAISRYLANAEGSALYPAEPKTRALVDQWLDFFALHPGRWLTTLFFETIVKKIAGRGERNEEKCEEATGFAHQQLKVVEQHLQNQSWLVGNTITIADLCALAYMEQIQPIGFSLQDYPKVESWFNQLDSLESVGRVRAKTAPYLKHLAAA